MTAHSPKLGALEHFGAEVSNQYEKGFISQLFFILTSMNCSIQFVGSCLIAMISPMCTSFFGKSQEKSVSSCKNIGGLNSL